MRQAPKVSVTVTPEAKAGYIKVPERQLAIVRAGVFHLRTAEGLARWAAAGWLVRAVVSCERGDNGWAHFQAMMECLTELAQVVPETALVTKARTARGKEKFAAEQQLRNAVEQPFLAQLRRCALPACRTACACSPARARANPCPCEPALAGSSSVRS